MNWKEKASKLSLTEQWNELFNQKSKLYDINNHTIWSHVGTDKLLKNSENLRDELKSLFKSLRVKIFTDIGCGDWLWMKEVNLSKVDYLGVDIVERIIESNKKRFPNVKFECLNIVEKRPRKSDLIMERSVFIHLSLIDIKKALINIKKSGSKYLLCTHNPGIKKNADTKCLMLKKRNMLLEPFNFPKPVYEFCERGDIYMALWNLKDISI